MRAILTAAVVLGVCLLPAAAVRAGVYNTAEPLLFPVTWKFPQFQSVLGDLRGAAVDRPGKANPLREHYLKQVAELEAKERSEGLTVDDRVNLGAYYLRLLRPEDAVRVLEPALRQEADNFMVLANLAMASHLAGPQDPARLSRAIEYQQEALKAFPDFRLGFTAEQIVWTRRSERRYLTLLQLRQQEVRLQPGRGAPETLDDLFPVRFVGPSGRYEAGTIAADQADRLPLEAVNTVSQLLLWLPFDNRLSWLHAELLNAQGDLQAASTIMDDLVFNRGYKPPELWAHRPVVLQAWRQASPVQKLLDEQGPAVRAYLGWELQPRGLTLTPGVGSLMDEAGWLALIDYAQRGGEFLDPMASSPSAHGAKPAAAGGAAPANATDASWLPDWRTFLVGLVTGAAVMVLIGQQVRQTRSHKGAKVHGAG
jgi:tetratricopeptide (TPR) repeat protein